MLYTECKNMQRKLCRSINISICNKKWLHCKNGSVACKIGISNDYIQAKLSKPGLSVSNKRSCFTDFSACILVLFRLCDIISPDATAMTYTISAPAI
jgi:hypothetical protein